MGADFDIYTSNNGYEALELQKDHKIKIIITDINMPGMNGIDLSKKMLNNDSNCKIFLISGCSHFLSIAKNADINVVDYFEKPFKFTVLKERIKLAETELLS